MYSSEHVNMICVAQGLYCRIYYNPYPLYFDPLSRSSILGMCKGMKGAVKCPMSHAVMCRQQDVRAARAQYTYCYPAVSFSLHSSDA